MIIRRKNAAVLGMPAKIALPALLFLLVFAILTLRSGILSIEYKIGQLESQRKEALKEKKNLMAKRASALSMKEVEQRGMLQAGLVFPDRDSVIHVRRDAWDAYAASLRGEMPPDEPKAGNH